ncbi:class A beta-lactamase [Halotalea alkalilenta]|uniref:Beta-lactamase n=2 Tax=Halotalea alkalilenta TaxID=376489 RepID=A0A172YI92_9GAMM|nr:class A beta-lactamase [Halotalea alkalilenta]ANF58755.1 class A beta-lactamase [Halotalea alkalilenta]
MKFFTLLLGVTLMASTAGGMAQAADDAVLIKAREIEQRLEARVGLAIYDTGSNQSWLYKADERFPMASTFKAFACATLLHQVDAGGRDLDQTVALAEVDLVPYAPVMEKLVGQRVSLGELCAAAMRTSDNLAANKVLDSIGGPQGVTAFMRSIGDDTTRLDRWEPDLNQATPGDVRDTTSPAAIATSLRELVLGDTLSASSRARLTAWLVENEVGGPLLRSGIPQDWRIGDRTGAGGYGSRGVVAVIWPPEREPIVAAIYITGTNATMDERNAAIAELGEALAAAASR